MQIKLLPLLVALVPFAAHAQSQAPGLWESTMTMKTPDGQMETALAEMQKQLASMPPEQRKRVEAAMAGRGVKLGANGTTTQTCLTKEQASRPAQPQMQGSCTTSDVQRTATAMKFKFECTKPPSRGEGEWTFTSPKTYTGKIAATSQVGGKPQPMTIEMSGKWLSADCGAVKPFVMPTPQ